MCLRISIGKIDDSPSKITSFQVPISSLAFQPQPPLDNAAQGEKRYRLLVAGGSSIALWSLAICPEALNDLSASHEDTVNDREPPKGEQQTSSVNRWLHAQATTARVSSEVLLAATDHAPAYVLRIRWSSDGQKFASADGSQIFLWEPKKGSTDMWGRATAIVESSE